MQSVSNTTNSNKTLYVEKKDCCGCGVCSNVCPKEAIEMKMDSFGALYPVINLDICIGCNLCSNSCSFSKSDLKKKIIKAYAVANNNNEQLRVSSSGGVFSAVASYFLDSGDAVCGAIIDLEKEEKKIHHCIITEKESLKQLQGSKYGQSFSGNIYDECRELLKKGKRILFTGTPCQVNAFKHLFKKYESRIFTLDLICHGVPGNGLFDEYIRFIENLEKYRIIKFVFRDKKYGWGCNGEYTIRARSNTNGLDDIYKEISPMSSSYYRYFFFGDSYRDSCYSCQFASNERVGDITIGDYWGIEKHNPELLKENQGKLIQEKGISCALINTEKGLEFIDILKRYCSVFEVNIDDVISENTQLKHPVKKSKMRERLLTAYEKRGYIGIETVYAADMRKKKAVGFIIGLIPGSVKRKMKRMLKR